MLRVLKSYVCCVGLEVRFGEIGSRAQKTGSWPIACAVTSRRGGGYKTSIGALGAARIKVRNVVGKLPSTRGPIGDTQLGGSKPRLCQPMYPYATLRSPTYRENSHANHTWQPQSYQTACFKGSEAPPVWVRFPSPAPLFRCLACPCVVLGRGSAHRPVPTVSTRLQSFLLSDASIGSSIEIVLDAFIRPSSTRVPADGQRPLQGSQKGAADSFDQESWQRSTHERC